MITGSPEAVEPDNFDIEDDTIQINVLTVAPTPSAKQLTDQLEACYGDIFLLLKSCNVPESEYEKGMFLISTILEDDQPQKERFNDLTDRYTKAAIQLSGRRAIGELVRFNYAEATTTNVLSMIKYCLEGSQVAKPKEIGQTEPEKPKTVSNLRDALSKECPTN